jgi:putative phosphoribosyl transferase
MAGGVTVIFRDRSEAGKALAKRLGHYAGQENLIVLGIPRGGISVAFEVAQALEAPLEAFICRKLGAPGEAQLAFGAIGPGGVRVLDAEIISALGISKEEIEATTLEQQKELERRERLYRGDRAFPKIQGRVAILVDDGVATGSSMLAAVKALGKLDPARIVVAVPVASQAARARLSREADEFICLDAPRAFYAIAQFYDDFEQVPDEQVQALLERSARRPARRVA